MSAVPIPELLYLAKLLQASNFAPDRGALVRLQRANELVDRDLARLRAVPQLDNEEPDTEVKELESGRDAIFHAHAALAEKLGDRALTSELKPLADALASLHDKINALCWLVGESQADHDETLPGQFGSADDLFDALGV
jgi:hypothetical protein